MKYLKSWVRAADSSGAAGTSAIEEPLSIRPLYSLTVFLLLLCLSSILCGQDETWRDKIAAERQRWEQQKDLQREKWDQQNADEQARWQDYINRESADWRQYVDEVQQLWRTPKFSGVKNWVGYDAARTSRFEVNFETGDLRIEVITDQFEQMDKLQQQAIEMMTRLMETRLFPHMPAPDVNPLQPVDPQSSRPVIKPYRYPDGRRGSQLSLQLSLPENHLQQRAEIVRPFVENYCRRFNIDPELAMAIIHSESSFNPRAMSTFPMGDGKNGHAYGLMQIVPHSGGAEAYKTLGRSGQPTPTILFDPDKNLEIGIAYINRLKFHYFPGIQSRHSQQMMIAAAYNTGPGNAARAFTGKRDIAAAIIRINQLSGLQTQERLLRQLPYAETRRYLAKIIERLAMYRAMP